MESTFFSFFQVHREHRLVKGNLFIPDSIILTALEYLMGKAANA